MIWIFVNMYINFTFLYVLSDNYKLYLHIQKKDNIGIRNVLYFNTTFLCGLLTINNYFMYKQIKQYLF